MKREPSLRIREKFTCYPNLSKVMTGCMNARVIIFDTSKGAMVLTMARAQALSLQDPFAEQRSALGSRMGLPPRLMLKSR